MLPDPNTGNNPRDEPEEPGPTPARDAFPLTRWTRILKAADEGVDGERALEEVCRLYWYPLYAFVRRQGHSAHDAEDITQGFFAELLSGRRLAKADRTKGRLRTYLLSGLKHYIFSLWRKQSAQKRGAGMATLSLDQELADGRFVREPADSGSPERQFEKNWALTTLDRAIGRLQQEYDRKGQTSLFKELAPLLANAENPADYRRSSRILGMNEGAVRVALHRMKKRYRDCLVAEISETVESPDLVEDELESLIRALG